PASTIAGLQPDPGHAAGVVLHFDANKLLQQLQCWQDSSDCSVDTECSAEPLLLLLRFGITPIGRRYLLYCSLAATSVPTNGLLLL
ncbi:MAG: hypothetical protein NZU63_03255, partial [Gemmataceae bacterium]|nr:hypothetical protein [Gemmataceae bacterium]